MTLDAGIHHLGTEPIHILPVWVLFGIGWLLDVPPLQWFAAGIMVTLLFGNLRCRAPYYRWRVRDAGPRDCES